MLYVFPLSLPTLIFCADPKVFIAIFRQRLLKSDLFFYIMLIKKFPPYLSYFFQQ